MARTTGPLLSLGGSGSIAKTQVYSTWRGIPYARQYVKPSNPQTAEQTVTRSLFSWLNGVWKLAPALVQAPWTANAKGKQFTDRNKFIGDNVKLMRGETDLAALVLSPGANGGPVSGGFTPTGGNDQITFAMTAPDLPTGWTITKAVFAAIADADPQTANPTAIVAASDASSPYAGTLSSLDPGDYLAAGWFEYLKPNGTVAYGPSQQAIVTVT